MSDNLLKNKRVAMIIAFHNFRDEELFIPRSVISMEGAQVSIVSNKKGDAIGSYGGSVGVDLILDELKVSDFDVILFIGGSGAVNYIENEKCHKIAQETLAQNKVLGAICIAPAILARSGVLEKRKATVWSSTLDKSAVKILKEEGADYQKEEVVIDKNIITASGPHAARRFGEAVMRVLQNYRSSTSIVDK